MFSWRTFPTRPGFAAGSYLTAPSLWRAGIRVAYTTRAGGSGAPPYESLNVSFSSGDDPGVVRRNRARALAALGAGPQAWTSGRQVHGATVTRVGERERGRGAEPGTSIPDTDALWTDTPGVALAVRVADCVPLVLADPDRGRVAVVHAGWRGMVAGAIEATARAIGGPDALHAYVGPSIGPCCFEVGDDVADRARACLGDAVVVSAEPRATRWHLDLWRGARIALRRAGVPVVHLAMMCTRCESHRFFSHRAGDGGRQAVIAMIADGH